MIPDQECADVKDQLNDLVPWLQKLMVILAKVNPDDDSEEIKRRSELARFVPCLTSTAHPKPTMHSSLEDIGKRALALSDKGKVTRLIDRNRDLGKVVGLVEELRRAVLIYQVGTSHCRNRNPLISGVGDTTTIYKQPDCPFDRKFLFAIPDFRTQRMADEFKASFNAVLKLREV